MENGECCARTIYQILQVLCALPSAPHIALKRRHGKSFLRIFARKIDFPVR
jgi:hypothetical protein